MEDSAITVGLNSLIFRIMSRQGCLIHQNLEHAHGCFPYVMFRLIKNPDLGESLAMTKPCVMDPWSRELLRKFPGFCGEMLQQCLHSTCYGIIHQCGRDREQAFDSPTSLNNALDSDMDSTTQGPICRVGVAEHEAKQIPFSSLSQSSSWTSW